VSRLREGQQWLILMQFLDASGHPQALFVNALH
jgi:hypothetical protein